MTSWLFKSADRATDQALPAAGLRIQSSVEGKPIPLLIGGQARWAGNLIEYLDFTATAVQQSGAGGKGGIAGGGGKGGGGAPTYTYRAAVIIALGEGPNTVLGAWNDKTATTLAAINATAFVGDYSQTAWGYLTSLHPDRALAYRGIVYAAFGTMDLGQSAELPNLSFESQAAHHDAISGAPDADAKDCVVELLTNAHWGLGFPSGRLAALTVYSGYTRALGLVMSPVLIEQQEAGAILTDWMAATNSEAVWSGGQLNIVPYGDVDLSANGATYTAPATAQYDLTDADFLRIDDTTPPVQIRRKPPVDRKNAIKVECLDRGNAYNPKILDAKNDAEITVLGIRPADVRSYHFLCLPDAAQVAASLLLAREQVANEYEFTLPPKFVRLEPMDIVSVTDSGLEIVQQWVRIKGITRNPDRSRTIVAEEYLRGTGQHAAKVVPPDDGHTPNYEVSPGDINAPLMFEPTKKASGGLLEVWVAVSGVDHVNYGGVDMYVSGDGGASYQVVDRQVGPARMGVLTDSLPAVAPATTGPTIDDANTLSVDLAESASQLTSGTTADAVALNTLCYVDTEFLSYRDATLTGGNAYDLDYLVRGAHGSVIGAHSPGAVLCRIDDGILRIPYTKDRIGTTIHVKFVPFNIWQRGQPSIADVADYTYTILGTANIGTEIGDLSDAIRDQIIDQFRGVSDRVREISQRIAAIAADADAHAYLGKAETDSNVKVIKTELSDAIGGVSASVLTLQETVVSDHAALGVFQTQVNAQVGEVISSVSQIFIALANFDEGLAAYKTEVNERFGAVTASVTDEHDARVTADEGLAADIETTTTSIGNLSAGGIFQVVASAGTDGAIAVADLQVRASLSDLFATAGIQLAAMVDILGNALSRTRIHAQLHEVGYPEVAGGDFRQPYAIQLVSGTLQIALSPQFYPDRGIPARAMAVGAVQADTIVPSGDVTKTATAWNNSGAGASIFDTISVPVGSDSVLDIMWSVDTFGLPDGAIGAAGFVYTLYVDGILTRNVSCTFGCSYVERVAGLDPGNVAIEVRFSTVAVSSNRLTLVTPRLFIRENKVPQILQVSGGTPVASVDYRTSLVGGSGGTSGSFTAVDIGTADAHRVVVVALGWTLSAATPSLTINGVAADLVQLRADWFGADIHMALFSLSVPTGTTADIVASIPGSPQGIQISVWKVVSVSHVPAFVGSFVSYDSDPNSGINSTVSVITGQVMIAAVYGGDGAADSFSGTWGGADTLSERADAATSTTPNMRHAAYDLTSAHTTSQTLHVYRPSNGPPLVGVIGIWQ